MNTFHITVATADKTLMDGRAVHCRARTAEGAIGIEAKHEPLLATLVPGSRIEIRPEAGHVEDITVGEGMLSFANNHCVIILSAASEGTGVRGSDT